jgi:hypothetical protein
MERGRRELAEEHPGIRTGLVLGEFADRPVLSRRSAFVVEGIQSAQGREAFGYTMPEAARLAMTGIRDGIPGNEATSLRV